MKNIVLMFVLLIGLVSCNSKQTPINELSDLSEEIKDNSAGYSQENWEKAAQEFEMIAQEFKRYQSEYTDEDLREIGRLEGICLAYFTKQSLRSLNSDIKNAIKETEGILDGFINEFSEEDFNKIEIE